MPNAGCFFLEILGGLDLKKTMAEIAEMIQVLNSVDAWRDIELTGVCFDTRQIKTGDLFVPFVGESRDGHAFVTDAYDAGASAALWQKDVPNPPAGVPILMVEDTLTALQNLAKAICKK